MIRHKAQLLSYMKLMNIPLGIVINFGDHRLGKRGQRPRERDADEDARIEVVRRIEPEGAALHHLQGGQQQHALQDAQVDPPRRQPQDPEHVEAPERVQRL